MNIVYMALHDVSIKICIVGDSGSGKTSLMEKFIYDAFQESHVSTIGIDYRCKTIKTNDKKVKINIWDTAGQERFGEIIKSTYRNSNGVIITFDTTNYISFANLHKWMDNVINAIDIKHSCIILVGTKNDLTEERQVLDTEVFEYIETINNKYKHMDFSINYHETSSKTGENIDLVFLLMSEMILYKMKTKPEKQETLKLTEQPTSISPYTYLYNASYGYCVVM